MLRRQPDLRQYRCLNLELCTSELDRTRINNYGISVILYYESLR
jgi:hypothetical protein